MPGRPASQLLQLCRLAAAVLLALSAPARAFNDGLGEPPKDLDRSSPYATAQGFLSEARRGNFEAAAYFLWLDGLPKEEQPVEGARLARRLRFVLDRQGMDLAALPREGDGASGSVVLTSLELDGRPTSVRLVRVRTGDSAIWIFSRDTVRAVDALYDAYGPPLGERMPEFLFATRFGLELWQWLGLFVTLVSALLLGWLGEKLLLAVLGRLTRLTQVSWDDELVVALRGPLKLLVWIAVFQGVRAHLLLPPGVNHAVGLVCRSLGILAVAWFARRALDVATAAMQRALAARGTVDAAGARTQLAVLWRLLTIVIYVVGLAALLMQFEAVRTVGVSLLASAGVVGVVIGLAAQKSIGALFAGIQLSMTQPIRIGDRVTVDGETGTVLEISLTYVVIELWDGRNVVAPVTLFLEKPFQNWNKRPGEMIAAVLLQLDYRVDVGAVRAELTRILEGPGRSLWTGTVAKVHVTDLSEATATLRLAASTADTDTVFELRCIIREQLLAFLRDHPEWLPTQRVEQKAVAHGTPPAA